MEELYRHYIDLGIRPGATGEEIKKAYRALARRWHPDRARDEQKRRIAEDRIRRINAAYRALMEYTRAESFSFRSGQRPAVPGHDPLSWRQSVAESGRAAESLEDDQAFYRRALDLHFRGMADFKAGRLRDSVSRLTQSIGMVQNNPDAYLTLGRAHCRLNQLAKSASAYQQAVRLDPDSAESHFELGSVLLLLGDFAGAERESALLEELNPSMAEELRKLNCSPAR